MTNRLKYIVVPKNDNSPIFFEGSKKQCRDFLKSTLMKPLFKKKILHIVPLFK